MKSLSIIILLIVGLSACNSHKSKKPTRTVITHPKPNPRPTPKPNPKPNPVDPKPDPKPDPVKPPVDPKPTPKPKVYATVKCDYYGHAKYYKDILELKDSGRKRGHLLNGRFLINGRSPFIKCNSIAKMVMPENNTVPEKTYRIKCSAKTYYSDAAEMKKMHCMIQSFTYKGQTYRACRVMPSPRPPAANCVDIAPEKY